MTLDEAVSRIGKQVLAWIPDIESYFMSTIEEIHADSMKVLVDTGERGSFLVPIQCLHIGEIEELVNGEEDTEFDISGFSEFED